MELNRTKSLIVHKYIAEFLARDFCINLYCILGLEKLFLFIASVTLDCLYRRFLKSDIEQIYFWSVL